MTHAFPDPRAAPNVRYNPSRSTLRSLAEADETTTEWGSPSYVSEYRSRSADRTANANDDQFAEADAAAVEDAQAALRETPLVCLDRRLGRHPDLSFTCRYYVPESYARIALSWATLLEPAPEGAEPDFRTVQLPDWQETRIRVFPDAGVTYVLGSDYTGEAKKSFLRLFMYEAKRVGGLGLHAGAKRLYLEGADEPVGQLFLGLSATGKTTLTCHGFDLDDGERAELVQDDVCALLPDGAVAGSEGGGLYIKTDDLSPKTHPQLYRAATRPEAVLENVAVAADGTVDFADDGLTSNGRAAVRRTDVPTAADDIDLEAVHHVFFITRNPLMPPLARLSPPAAAAAFMLGESIQTSAGDPDAAGDPVRVVGTNPFIVGPPGEEGNRFLDLVAANDIDCFLVNTGHVGDADPVDIGVDDTVALLRAVARGTVTWRDDPALGLTVPADVPGLDLDRFYPPDRVADYADRLGELRAERRRYLAQFDDLRPTVRETAMTAERPSAPTE
ncbi:MAG: phosphoenolpyruvate carboxykinase (ATP) [Halobacteriales archaeon]